MEAVHLLIQGRVQGVFFRKFPHLKALELNIRGWVRNLPDGRVEVVAEGDPERLQRFIHWCHEGPEAARVDEVEIHPTPLKNFREFVIVR